MILLLLEISHNLVILLTHFSLNHSWISVIFTLHEMRKWLTHIETCKQNESMSLYAFLMIFSFNWTLCKSIISKYELFGVVFVLLFYTICWYLIRFFSVVLNLIVSRIYLYLLDICISLLLIKLSQLCALGQLGK